MGRGGTPRQSSQSLGAQAFGQQSKANKPVQKSLAPYNPHAVKTRPDNGRPAAGWSGPGPAPGGPAPEAGGLGGRAADRPAVAGNAPEPSNGHDTASKATDFAAFLKKAPAPQGMRLPDQLNNGPKKEDIAALPTGQSVPYVRPADRVAMESAQESQSQGGNVGGGNAALELIQRNKSHTAKAAAQIPFERKGGDGGRGPPHRNDDRRNDRSERNERNGILNRNAHRNGGRERPSGNERAERGGGGGGGGDKGLGDRLALARGMAQNQPLRRTPLPTSARATSAPGAATTAVGAQQPGSGSTSPSSPQEPQIAAAAAAVAVQHQPELPPAAAAAAAAAVAAGSQDDPIGDADLDFERLMRDMVRTPPLP